MTPFLEYKDDDGKQTTTWSAMPIPFAVGECTAHDPPIEMKSKSETSESKMKIAYTYGKQCSEYGGFSFTIMGKSHADCITVEKVEEDAFTHTVAGVASYCTLEDDKWEDKKNEQKWTMASCNPANASVAGIILGSVALALSLAGIGLAAMAAGKKGGSPPPAKPAAPAAPAGEAAPQGSTTAAAAVGAATEA